MPKMLAGKFLFKEKEKKCVWFKIFLKNSLLVEFLDMAEKKKLNKFIMKVA